MTRILLHPHDLPRCGPDGSQRVQLNPPWAWWRVHLNGGRDLYHQCYDDPRDVREYSVLVAGQGWIEDPPVMRIKVVSHEYDGLGLDLRRAVVAPTRGVCEVVWYECPGEGWYQLPGNTCRPGQYRIDIDTGLHDLPADDGTDYYDGLHLPTLDDMRQELAAARRLNAEEICRIYGVPAQAVAGPFLPLARAPLRPVVNPEDEVINEIDRLEAEERGISIKEQVNDQLRLGPCEGYR